MKSSGMRITMGLVFAALLAAIGGGFYYVKGSTHSILAAGPTAQAAAAGTAADQATALYDASSTDNAPLAESQKSGATINADAISQVADAPAGYVQYRNTKYGFSFYHLPDGKITEYDEGSGAETVVLENLQKVRGMQVFIVPYDRPLITQERFNEDEPSGVRINVQDASLDGVRAVTFNSTDIALGETREIWVIRNGYLYEITTFSGVGEWFTPIIQSWRWI